MIKNTLKDIDENVSLLYERIRQLQNEDGGFKAFLISDKESGIWTTAQIVHICSKTFDLKDEEWVKKAVEYLLVNQNEDGGWPFRPKGTSITDMTAWACLALSHSGNEEALQKGVSFLLDARHNEGVDVEAGWGLTKFGEDRVYSTYIASYCLARLLRFFSDSLPESSLQEEMTIALSEAKELLIRKKNSDGGWGSSVRFPTSNYTNTAFALLALFMPGEDPQNYVDSFDYLYSGNLHSGIENYLWDMESEQVVTREGYELTQEWFTSIYCFQAYIYFAEMDITPMKEIDNVFNALSNLIQPDGNVKIGWERAPNVVSAIPLMIDTLTKYKYFINSKKEQYEVFLQGKRQHQIEQKKERMLEALHHHFPYPISQVCSQFDHELDYHRKFQFLLQLYEVIMKYSTIVCLSAHLAAHESNDKINALLEGKLTRPTLGDWGKLLVPLLKESQGVNEFLHPIISSDLIKKRRNYLDENAEKQNLTEILSHITSIRNATTGHGALRSLYEYKQFVENEQLALYSFLDRMFFLAKYNSFLVLAAKFDEFGDGDIYKIRLFNGLEIQDSDLSSISTRLSEGQKEHMIRYVYFQNTKSNKIINLYPFLSYMFCQECKKQQFFFYNFKCNNNKTSYLSYECGHEMQYDNAKHFAKRLSTCDIIW